MIQIFVGQDNGPPFLVPQSTLCNASKYFAKAIKNEHLGEGQAGVLRFPEDNLKTWGVLLFWVVNSALPKEVHPFDGEMEQPNLLLLCQTWIMADKYLLPQLQNKIMLKLLRVSDHVTWSLEVVGVELSNTLPGSPLRRLATEEAVDAMFQMRDIEATDLDAVEIVGLMSSMLIAVRDKMSKKDISRIINNNDIAKVTRPDTYMVCTGVEWDCGGFGFAPT